jgi:hypothetical protein
MVNEREGGGAFKTSLRMSREPYADAAIGASNAAAWLAPPR